MQISPNYCKSLFPAAAFAAVGVGSALAVPFLWRVVADAGHAARSGVPLRSEEVLTAVLASAALLALVWLAAGVLLEVLGLVPGVVGRAAREVASVVTPAVVRRVVGGLLGVGVVAGLAPGAAVAGSQAPVAVTSSGTPSPALPATGAASAVASPLPDPGFGAPTDPGSTPPQRQRQPRSTAPEGGWVPEPPVVRTQPDVRVLTPSPRPRSRPETAHEVVVHRGDTLWSLAARYLGSAASDAEIARAWPRWYAANRSLIGDDPDLLRPGQRLRPPEEVGS